MALAIIARAGVGIATQSWRLPSTDDHWAFGYEMGRIAGSLAAGDGYSYPTDPPRPTAWMPPIYPLVLAAVFRVLGSFSVESARAIEIFQVAASALSCAMLFLIGSRLYGTAVGCLSAFMLALYPASVHFAVQKIWSTSLSTLLLLILLYLFTVMLDRPTTMLGLVVGLVLGMGVLTDPLIFSIVPPIVIFAAISWKSRKITSAKSVGICLLTFSVVMAPWLIRNCAVFKALVPVKSNFGHELFLGNHGHATGVLPPKIVGIERQYLGLEELVPGAMLSEVDERYLRNLNEVEQNRFLLKKAIHSIAEDPVRFVELSTIRFFRFWTVSSRPYELSHYVNYVAYFLVLLLAFVGSLVALRERLPSALILIIVAFYPIAHYVTIVGLYRYRYPLEPVLLIAAALALSRLPPLRGCRVLGLCGEEPRALDGEPRLQAPQREFGAERSVGSPRLNRVP
ncbi:MAG TPA: glycosyltransferase family 39 protein [Thermoanaerobaculia bacterium]|nr:glycosyltransferase family 39 protein [Thermoanaerobaculia bacterium]